MNIAAIPNNLAPIIILSSERSGSNLLRSLIDNHSRICSPVPPHILVTFTPLSPHYGDLREKENVLRLLGDMIEFVAIPYHDWKLNLTPKQVYKIHRPKSMVQAFYALYMAKANLEGKKRFCSKDIESFYYALKIKSEFPFTKFIYLIRDPRDQVASWMRRPIAFFTVYDAVQKWIKDQQACLDLLFHWGIDAHIIRYEDLISNTPEAMLSLLEFLGEEPEKNCFDTDQSKGRSVSWNPYWQNLSKPILKGNAGKYIDTLDEAGVILIETLTKKIMKFHGYAPSTQCNWKAPINFEQENVALRNRRKKENQPRIEKEMKKLIEKWEFIKNLRKRLAESHLSDLTSPKSNLQQRSLPLTRKNIVFNEVKLRLRFLLQAILGETLITRFLMRIR